MTLSKAVLVGDWRVTVFLEGGGESLTWDVGVFACLNAPVMLGGELGGSVFFHPDRSACCGGPCRGLGLAKAWRWPRDGAGPVCGGRSCCCCRCHCWPCDV